jgi:cytosine/adenosine deaminase-related metal-dependent hydrolase
VELLARWGVLGSGVLLVHCNHLSRADLDMLGRAGNPVVFCPRSSSNLGAADHPRRELQRRGVVVAVGTDSLASSPSLNVLDELQVLSARHPDLPPHALLSLVTTAGAHALGMASSIGMLRPGMAADFVVWPQSPGDTTEPVETLVQSGPTPRAVYVAGRRVAPADG